MKLEERSVTLRDGTRALLRSPEICDAERLNAYLRQTSGETHFMVRYPEECNQTLETAQKRLQAMLEDERSFMLAAFIDGELVGNCGVNEIADRLKMRHRASLGISIKKKAWGLGLGTILISRALEQAKENGFTQVELGVFADNERAIYKKKAWGLGLGTILISRALEQAKENGFTQVELGVFADNERAIYLYRKLGFTEMGCIPKAFCLKDGTYRDEVQMVKFL